MAGIHKIYRHSDQLITDAFDRTAVSLQLMCKKKGYKMFALSGSEPNSGTTTMSIELAISTSRLNKKTLLIDGDIRKAAKDKRLSNEVEKGLSDYLEGVASLDSVILETNIKKLDYIACGSSVENVAGCFSQNRIDEMIGHLSEEYDNIFWDMPALSAAVDAQIVGSKVDGIIIVSPLGGSKDLLLGARAALDRVEANIVGVLGNKVDQSEYKSFNRDYKYFYEKKYKNRARRSNIMTKAFGKGDKYEG